MTADKISKLRAQISNKSRIAYEDILSEYDSVVSELSQIERSKICIRILVDLYGNLDHNQWKETVNCLSLIHFVLKCSSSVKCTTNLESKQFLTSLCNLHRFLVKQNIPFELGLELSSYVLQSNCNNSKYPSPFAQIYWIVYVDKLSFLENNKAKLNMVEIHPKILAETIQIMEFSDLIPFCREKLLWLLNKVQQMFGDLCEMLHVSYKNIFLGLSAHKLIKSEQTKMATSCKDALYKSLFRSFYLVMQGALRHNFKKCALVYAVKFTIELLHEFEGVIGLLNSVYLSLPGVMVHYTALPDTSWKVLQRFLQSLRKVDTEITKIALPNISRIICLHIDHLSKPDDMNLWKQKLNAKLLEQYIELLKYFLGTMEVCEGITSCDKCPAKTGLHDCINVCTSGRSLILKSVENCVVVDKVVHGIAKFAALQMSVPLRLKKAGCVNWKLYFSSHAAGLHNDSIVYYKYKQLELSRTVLTMCINEEVSLYHDPTSDVSLQQIASRFYSLSLWELDSKRFDSAVVYAFAAVICGDLQGFSVVVKAKYEATNHLKNTNSGTRTDPKLNSEPDQMTRLQMLSVLDAAMLLSLGDKFGNIASIFADIGDLSLLLLKELETYTAQWGATCPLSGVCKAFISIINWSTGKSKTQPDWLAVPIPLEAGLRAGKAIILAASTTSSLARPEFKELTGIVVDLIQGYFCKMTASSSWEYIQCALILATCLYLKTEFKMTDIREKFHLMIPTLFSSESKDEHEDSLPPDLTIEEESEWLEGSLKSADILVAVSNAMQNCGGNINVQPEHRKMVDCCISFMLANLELLRTHSANVATIKTAWAVANIGNILKDSPAVLRSVGCLISMCHKPLKHLQDLIAKADSIAAVILTREVQNGTTDSSDVGLALCYLLDLAVYKWNTGSANDGVTILKSVEAYVALNIECDALFVKKIGFSFVRLLEVQALFCSGNNQDTKGDGITSLSAYGNAFREIVALRMNTAVAPRSAASYHSLRMSLSLGKKVAEISWQLSIMRRSRAAALSAQRSAARSGINACAATLLLKAARTSAECDRIDDCQSKLTASEHIIGVHEPFSLSINSRKQLTPNIDDLTSIADLFASNCSTTVIATPVKLPEIIIRAASVRKKTTKAAKLPTTPVKQVRKMCECCLCTEPSRMLLRLEYLEVKSYCLFKIGQTEEASRSYEELFKTVKSIEKRLEEMGNELKELPEDCLMILSDHTLMETRKVQLLALVDYCYMLIASGRKEEVSKTLSKITQLSDRLSRNEFFEMQKIVELLLTFVFVMKLNKEPENETKPHPIRNMSREKKIY